MLGPSNVALQELAMKMSLFQLFIPFSSTIKTVGWVFRDSSVSSVKTKSIRFPPTYASCRIVKIARVAKEIGARQRQEYVCPLVGSG